MIIDPDLPRRPDAGEEARRIVRHGMADILDWLGEDVGPRPDQGQHIVFVPGSGLHVSPQMEAGARSVLAGARRAARVVSDAMASLARLIPAQPEETR